MKHLAIFFILLLTVVLALFPACDKKPSEPEYGNPFDIENKDTKGDPFQLTAQIANGGITLTWTKPEIEGLHSFKVYRSEQENSGYTQVVIAPANQTQYVDQTVLNGHNYYYRVTAVNKAGQETSQTNTAAINIKTEPVLVINEGAQYTAMRMVSLTILAHTAQQMIIANNADLSDGQWENYATSKTWLLAAGAGQKRVYLKVKYENGMESSVIFAGIEPLPMEPGISIGFGEFYTPTRDIKVTLLASGINLQMIIAEDENFTGHHWQVYQRIINYTLSDGEGVKQVFAKFKNDFEVESSIVSHYIIYDTPPKIALTVTPDSGITDETIFQFDPTGSTDVRTPDDRLQVRFDWENKGSWNTGWIQSSVISHKYTIGGGNKTVRMELRDAAGWIVDTTITVFVNTYPQAEFFYSRDKNNPTRFLFDAGLSFDYEDGRNLEYRWDFDGDGTWDTPYSSNALAQFEYSADEDYFVTLSVRDRNFLASQTTLQIKVFETGTLTDIDGNVYRTIKVGDQWWMAENLKVTHYRNGESIPNVTDNSQWTNLSMGARCAYDNDDNNIETYGLLYNWYAVSDSRNIAPEGWHVPTDEEWKELEMYLGMSQSEADAWGYRGSPVGGKLKEAGTVHWNSPNSGATNESGFTALPGGYRNYDGGAFSDVGYNGSWWSSTEFSSTHAGTRRLSYYSSDVSRFYDNKPYGFSVRCVRD